MIYTKKCLPIWISGLMAKAQSLPEKKFFYSHRKSDYITDANYMHIKRICRDFVIKNVGSCLDLYLQSKT